MKIFWQKHKEILILSVLAVVFFMVYAWFPWTVGGLSKTDLVFNSPDETANFFWTQRAAKGEVLYYWESDNGIGNGLVHPRSMMVASGRIIPGSFLGMILVYGAIARFLGPDSIIYLSAFFAAAACLFFYLLIRLIFGKKIAFLSAILLLLFPGWWYYASRGMYHNVFFVCLLIVGFYFLARVLIRAKKKEAQLLNYLRYAAAGIFLGLAILTRTSEIVWVSLIIILIVLFNYKRISWLPFVIFIALGATTFLFTLFYHNLALYGQLLSFSYRLPVSEFSWQGLLQGLSSQALFQLLVTPFGFHPKSIFINGFNYLVKFLWFWSVPAMFGLIVFLFSGHYFNRERRQKSLGYLFIFVLVSLYLLTFYGSWQLSDRVDQLNVSIGTSYLRYWLPIYLLILPFLAIILYELIRLFKYLFFKSLILMVFFLILFLSSLNLVLFETDESLALVKDNVISYQSKTQVLNNYLKSDDIVVTYPQADKFIFPVTKRLITALVVPYDYESLVKLIKAGNQVYYYTHATRQGVEYTSQRDFTPFNLQLINGKKIFQNDWLYQIVKTTNDNQ